MEFLFAQTVMGGGLVGVLVHLLIVIIVLGLIFWLVWWALGYLPPSATVRGDLPIYRYPYLCAYSNRAPLAPAWAQDLIT